MEALQRQNKRRQTTRRLVIAAVIAVLVVGSAALFFQKSTPPTVTIPTTTTTAATTTTVGTLSSTCATTPFAVPGFPTIACASPIGTAGKAPTMVIPTTAPPTVMQAADLIKGTGATLKVGDNITAQYVLGDYASHKILQSSWTSGPFTTPLKSGSLIAGWIKGLPGMKVGGRRELIIPPSLAYQQGGNGIPANDTLVFIVDLLKIG
jgi:peptidylprolyl isomerase